MTRKVVLIAFLALLALPASAAPAKPNIIFVLTDDLGWGDLGVFHQNSRDFANNPNLPAFTTPNIDSMAAQGVRMDRHYCPAPVCAPSRASLLLGVHQGHSNVRDNQFDKELADNHTLGTVLKQAGYATAAIGKWGLQGGSGFPGHPQNRGFDYFFGYMAHLDAHFHYPKEQGREFYENFNNIAGRLDKCYSTDLTAARAKRWIIDHQAATPSDPFFMYLCFPAPHAQLNVPTSPYPAGGGLGGGVQWNGTPGEMINTATGTIDSWIHPDYAGATWDHDNNSGTPEVAWPDTARRHATMLRRLDDAMGDLLQLLADLGIDDDTLVVFTSDNGPHDETGANGGSIGAQDPRFFQSYGPLDGIKRDVWEGGVRVPAIARWPDAIPAGRVSDHPSQFHDWLGTFAELAGVPVPFRSDGVSLVPDLTGGDDQREGIVYVEYTNGGARRTPNYADFDPSHVTTRGHMQAVLMDGYKAVRYDTTAANTPFRLYDVAADPQETTDLAGQPGVPTQQEIEARIARSRRAGGNTGRVYDSVPVPAAVPVAAPPVTILRTDFAGRQLASTAASGFAWTSDFDEESSATTALAFAGSASGFIGGYTAGSGALNPPGEPIPVAGNIENNGPWSTSFEFTPAAAHELGSVEVSCYAISGGGVHQLNPKNIRWDVTIQGDDLDESAFAAGTDPGGNGALNLAVGFPGIILRAGTTYTISLTAGSPEPTGGNNLALNSIALTAAAEEAAPPAGMKPGLNYATYEGEFPWVPDFSESNPATTGETSGLDLSVRPRDEDIGITFSGYLNVPSDGRYTFFLNSDTGAFVRLHDAQLVDADFGYRGGTERSSGPIPLTAGLHPIRIHYRHAAAASHTLSLRWQGPGITKQPVPEANLLIEGEAEPEQPAATDDETVATSGRATEIAVLENDRPGTGPEALRVSEVTQPVHGSARIASGDTAVTYIPKAGFAGTDSFAYTADNGFGTDSATVKVEVLPATSTIWLPFDETSGATARDALGRTVGTLMGFAVPDWVSGRWGGALRFFGDGDADSVVLAGNPGVTGTAARTICFWLNADPNQGDTRPTIISWGADNGTTPGIRFDINLDPTNGYRLRSEFNASGVNFETPDRSDLRGAGWVHCAIVVPENATVAGVLGYLDGQPATATPVPAGSGGTAINTSAINDITIGNWATNAERPFRGKIDDLRVYSRALSPGEISALAARTPQETAAAEWFFRHTGNDLPGETDWASDPDGDGLGTFLEYAVGGNPTLRSHASAPFLSDQLNFVFNRRRSGLPASAYAAEFSTTLEEGSWSPVEPVGEAPHPDLSGFDQVIVPLPSTQTERGFFRLRVTGP